MRQGQGISRLLLALGLVFSIIGVVGSLAALGAVTRHRGQWPEAEAERERDQAQTIEVIRNYPYMPDLDGGNDGPTVSDPAADDGELHDARRTDVEYAFTDGLWALSDVVHVDAYDMDVDCSFSVRFPQVVGNLEHVEAINALLKATAMESVHTYYEDPSEETVSMMRGIVEQSGDLLPENADMLLTSAVDYAVTYNNDNLLSVCFSDEYYLGSYGAGFIRLRTVNVDLQTGETYELADVLTVDDAVARSFVDNLVRTTGEDRNGDGTIGDDECDTVCFGGREALEQALQGKGELAEKRVDTCLFIDGNGKPNLGANYWLSSDEGFVRGWWDVTITDEQLASTKRDSRLWQLL